MFQTLLAVHFFINPERQLFTLSWLFFSFVFVVCFHCSFSSAASIVIFSSSNSSYQWKFMSNESYRSFLVRQYFLDRLNSSQPLLIQSMIDQHQLVMDLEQLTNKQRRRRRRSSPSHSTNTFAPMLTIPSSRCFVHPTNDQVHSIFHWSHSIKSVATVELVYHLNRTENLPHSLPIRILFKHGSSSKEFRSIQTNLRFDPSRDVYFLPLEIDRRQIPSIQIETIITHQTCQSSRSYLILSLSMLSSSNSSGTSACSLRSISIDFEELGLAYLIIRPKQYRFTYCDGSCSSTQPIDHSSIRSLFQSILHQKRFDVPQTKCVPSRYGNDQFLLRQSDGTMNIYPIENILVKQCACL